MARRRSERTATLARVVIVAAVALELGATVRYGRAASSGETAARLDVAFESGASELAVDVNRHLGLGWQGGWSVVDASVARPGAGETSDRTPGTVAIGDARGGPAAEGAQAGAAVWLDRRLRDGWASVPYLVPIERVTLTDPYDPVLTTGAGSAYLWPYDIDLERVWSDHPAGLRLSFSPGSRESFDAASDVPLGEARLLYVRVDATPAERVLQPLATFANGLMLVAAHVRPVAASGALHVTSEWETDRPQAREVTAFFQVLRAGRNLAGSDAPLGGEVMPVTYWLPGDRVVEERDLTLPEPFDPARHVVIAGLYEWPSLARIAVVDRSGGALADHAVLPR